MSKGTTSKGTPYFRHIIADHFVQNPGLHLAREELLSYVERVKNYRPTAYGMDLAVKGLQERGLPIVEVGEGTRVWMYKPNKPIVEPVINLEVKEDSKMVKVNEKESTGIYYECLEGPTEKGLMILKDEFSKVHIVRKISLDAYDH